MNQNVHHPEHYTQHPSGIECIEITELLPFTLGNAWKYIHRAGLKTEDKTEDLEKAIWYLTRELTFQSADLHYGGVLQDRLPEDTVDKVQDYLKHESDCITLCIWNYAMDGNLDWIRVALYLLTKELKAIHNANFSPGC